MFSMSKRALIGGALVLALIAVGTGTSYGSTSSKSVSLGTVHKAKGAPLTIGYEYSGQTQAIDTTPELATAKATVKYVNQYLGGVAGRPLALLPCADQGTPAGTTACANQFLAAKVPIVLSGEPTDPTGSLTLLSPAKVPYFFDTTGDTGALLSTDAWALANPLIIISAPIDLAKAAHAKHIGMITVNVPAAQSLPALAKPQAAKAGIAVTASAVPLGSADVTPQIQSLLSAGADYFLVIGDVSLCVSSLNALKTLGFKGQVTTEQNCLAGSTSGGVAGGYKGVNVPTTYDNDGTTAESKLLAAIGKKYAPGTPVGNQSNSGYLGYIMVSDFQRAMTGLTPANFTAAGITAALVNMQPQPEALLPNQKFQCNRKASTLLTSVCSNAGAIQYLSTTGKVTKTSTFNS